MNTIVTHAYEYDYMGRRIDRRQQLRNKIYSTRAQLRHTRENNRKRAGSYWVAAIYLEDLAYGGSEEGGWWYNCGSLIISPDVPFPIWWKAGARPKATIRDMWNWCDEQNKERRSISSVLSEGRYMVLISRNNLPTHYPRERPYYS